MLYICKCSYKSHFSAVTIQCLQMYSKCCIVVSSNINTILVRRVKMRKNRKIDVSSLVSRQEYLVVQSNDLAKAFGNLKAFEHKLLDYCVSFVSRDSNSVETFETTIWEILKYFDLTDSGENYLRVGKSLKTLRENTALYFGRVREDGKKSIVMSQLFSDMEIVEDGRVFFKFSERAIPYIFELKQNYYSFKLRELSNIKSKYTLVMLKIIESHRYGSNDFVRIDGTLEEWKEWFLGKDVSSKWTTSRFTQQVLTVALTEIEAKFPNLITDLTSVKRGRKIVGYEVRIMEKAVLPNTDYAAPTFSSF